MADEVAKRMHADKKALASWKANNDLHVLLIVRQDAVSKSTAVVQAYFEGVDGLNKRLSPH